MGIMIELFDVIIVGAGVAGMTAAIYAKRAGKSVLVIESKVTGGQIVNALEVRNWPGEERISGKALTERIYHQMNNLGVEFRYEMVEKIEKRGEGFVVRTDEGELRGRTVILATGSRDRPLGVPNEEKLVGHGISYCATCDGGLYRGQDVLVVGGGNTAMYNVLYLAGLARKVYLVHRREEFRAEAALVEKARKLGNVEMILGATPKLMDDGEKVMGFYTVPAGSSMTGVDEVTGDGVDEAILADPTIKPIAAVFVAIGREPNTEKFADLVKLDENGYVVAGEDGKTSCAGVFVAGDCRTKGLRQLVTAAGDGAMAATAAVEYLNRGE